MLEISQNPGKKGCQAEHPFIGLSRQHMPIIQNIPTNHARVIQFFAQKPKILLLIGWSLEVIDAQRFKHEMTRQAYILRTCNEYFKENDVLLMSDERMVMLLVGEWWCWRELCVCVGMHCRDGVRATVRKSTKESFLDHELFENILSVSEDVYCLRNKKVFVNQQVTMSQKSMAFVGLF
jgi:hypothetical protein